MPPDYYTLLGIPETATPRQIKAAYRRRMKECHPDLANMGPPAEKRRREALAKQINEAHAVLSDPLLRRRYDRLRRDGGPSARGDGRSASPLWFKMLRGVVRASLSGLEILLGGGRRRSTRR